MLYKVRERRCISASVEMYKFMNTNQVDNLISYPVQFACRVTTFL